MNIVPTNSPEGQEALRIQMVIQKVEQYGRKRVVKEGHTFIDDKFAGFRKLKAVVDFKGVDDGFDDAFTYVKDEKYPVRLCAPGDKVATVAQFKKIVPYFMKWFKNSNFLSKIVILVAFPLYRKLLIDYVWQGMRNVYYVDLKYYQGPVRAFYVALRPFGEKIRDIICAILEFDTAYRYRLQDIVGELNIEAFRKNPIKEIERLLGILFSREVGVGGATERFKKHIWIIVLYLKLNRKLMKKIVEVVEELDIEAVKLNANDRYWVFSAYSDYNFCGKTYQERQKEYLLIKNN